MYGNDPPPLPEGINPADQKRAGLDFQLTLLNHSIRHLTEAQEVISKIRFLIGTESAH